MASNKIRGIEIQITADTAGIMDGLKDINKSLSETDRALRDCNKLLKLDPENVTILAQKQEYLTTAIDQTAQKLEKQKELLETLKTSDNSEQTIEQQKALEREIEETTAKLNGYKTNLDQTNKSLQEMGEDGQKAGSSIKETADSLQLLAQSKAFSEIAKGAKEITDALLECVETAKQFEFAMGKVETLAHAGNGLDAWAKDIRTNAAEIGVSASDMAEAVYQAMSASVASEEAIGFAAQASKLAIGGFTDTATAVDITTTAINAYGLEIKDATHVMDNLVTTQNLGKTTVADLAVQMGRVIPTAAAYKVNIDNLSAAYAELTAKGTSTRISTTQINAMLGELGDSSKECSQILQELTGKNFAELMESGESLGNVLNILWETVDKDSSAFLELWGSADAGRAAFNLVSDGGERFNEILGEMQNNAGTMESNFETMANTGEMAGKRLQSSMENLKISIGDSLTPILDMLKEDATQVIDKINDWVEANPELVASIMGGVTAVTALTGVVTACAGAIALCKAAFGDLSGIVAVVGASAALGVGAFAGYEAYLGATSSSAKDLSSNLASAKEEIDATTQALLKADKVEALTNQIQNLNEKVSLTSEEYVTINALVAEYNELMEGTSEIILDNTGHIANLTDEQLELAEAQIALSDATAQYEAEQQKFNDAQVTYNKLIEEKAELEEEYANRSLLTAQIVRDHQEAEEELDEAIQSAQNSMSEAASNMLEYGETVDLARDQIDSLTTSQEEETVAAETNQAAIDALTEKLNALSDAIKSSVQNSLDLTQAWSAEWDTSTKQMTDNIQSQIDGITQWADNFAVLANASDVAINQEVLEYLANLGVEGAGLVQELVDTLNESPEQLQAWADAMAEYLSLDEEVADEILTTYTDFLTRIGEEGAAAVEETMPQITDQMANTYDTMQTDANTNKDKMVQITTDTIASMVTAINTNAPTVSDAIQKMEEAAIERAKEILVITGEGEAARSQVFYDMGMTIDTSLAQGITDGTSLVCEAITTMINEAIDSIDLSSVTSRLDNALASAIG